MSKPTVKTKIILTSCSIIIFAFFFYICAFMYPNQFEKYVTVLFSFPIVVMTLYSLVQILINDNFQINKLLIVCSSFISSLLSSFISIIMMSIWIRFQEPNTAGGNLTDIHIVLGNFISQFQNSLADLLNQLQNASSHTLSLLSLGFSVIPFTLICLPIFSSSNKRRTIYEWLITVVLFIVTFFMIYFAS